MSSRTTTHLPGFLYVDGFQTHHNEISFPRFSSPEYFVGVPFDARAGDLILDAEAADPDLDDGADLTYALRSSELYRAGETRSSGSLVPSPFVMAEGGRLTLGQLVAEFNQDRFAIGEWSLCSFLVETTFFKFVN